MIDLETLQGFIELRQGRSFGSAVELGHHENLLSIAFQGFSHAAFALTLVVIPGIVGKIDAAIDCAMKQPDGVRFAEVRLAQMVSAQPDAGYFFASFSEWAIRHFVAGARQGRESVPVRVPGEGQQC